MNTEITAFKFDTSNIRTVTKDDEIWFVATDIAEVLGYRDAALMTMKGVLTKRVPPPRTSTVTLGLLNKRCQ